MDVETTNRRNFQERRFEDLRCCDRNDHFRLQGRDSIDVFLAIHARRFKERKALGLGKITNRFAREFREDVPRQKSAEVDGAIETVNTTSGLGQRLVKGARNCDADEIDFVPRQLVEEDIEKLPHVPRVILGDEEDAKRTRGVGRSVRHGAMLSAGSGGRL